MPGDIIEQRTFEFARRIVKLCERLWERGPAARRLANQLFDAGTSIAANAAESQGEYTKPDFLARLAVSRKESWETIYWLRLAAASGLATGEEVDWELDEARQLRTMITQAIKTGQTSSSRERREEGRRSASINVSEPGPA